MYRFIESRTADDQSGYSVWEGRDGTRHYLADRLYGAIPTWWRGGRAAWQAMATMPMDELTLDQAIHAAKVDDLTLIEARTLVIEGEHDNMADCDCLRHEGSTVCEVGEGHTVDDGLWCKACVEKGVDEGAIHLCARCDDYSTTCMGVGGSCGCQRCYENHGAYCEACDERYWVAEENHEHDEDEDDDRDQSGDCCDSPMMEFTLPIHPGAALYDTLVSEQSDTHLGTDEPVLHNDVTYDVVIPGGKIRDDEWQAIRTLLADIVTVEYPMPESEIPFAGSNINYKLIREINGVHALVSREYKPKGQAVYAKRLRAAIYNKTKEIYGVDRAVSLTPGQVSQIGMLARKGSDPLELQVEVTRDLDLPAWEFSHPESCWWTDYSHSRCTLKSNAGFGIRSFGYKEGYGDMMQPTGRAWVYPCKVDHHDVLTPTFGTPDAYVVFNGYGALQEENGAKALAHALGLSAGLTVYSFYGENMYVNGNSARIVASPETLARPLRISNDYKRHGRLTLDPDKADREHEAKVAKQVQIVAEREERRLKEREARLEATRSMTEQAETAVESFRAMGEVMGEVTRAVTDFAGRREASRVPAQPQPCAPGCAICGEMDEIALNQVMSREAREAGLMEWIETWPLADAWPPVNAVGPNMAQISRLTVTRLDAKGNRVGETVDITDVANVTDSGVLSIPHEF